MPDLIKRGEKAREKIAFILSFGFFIFLFLFLFKPFGIDQQKTISQFFLTVGFGLITVFVLIIYKFLIEPVIIKRQLTLFESIMWNVLIAITIGIANYFYISVVYSQGFVLKYFLIAIWTAILVGILPVSITYFITINKNYRNALKKASISPEEVIWTNEVQLRAGNPKNDLKLSPIKILYLCSNDNYVTVVWLKGEAITKTHLRGTLKAAEKELSRNTTFFRCHKCFIVNSEYVDHITGNVQNMKIKLRNSETEIPVSRSKAKEAACKFRQAAHSS